MLLQVSFSLVTPVPTSQSHVVRRCVMDLDAILSSNCCGPKNDNRQILQLFSDGEQDNNTSIAMSFGTKVRSNS